MRSKELDSTDMRYIELQGVRANTESPFPNNAIISSKYSKYNFLPKCLFSQFYSLPKLWFLLISILELTQDTKISISYGTILPLAVLIFLGFIRDGYSDYIKHQSDKKINEQKQKVWDGTKFITKECEDILVGDIVILENNEIAPADMLILSVGNEEHECYADVSAVIGESNLKVKHPIKEIQSKIDSLVLDEASASLNLLNDDLIVNPPNKYFRHFHGKVKLSMSPRATTLDSDYLLLRGMKITNTPWIFGFVVYTGVETKIWINNLIHPAKVTYLKKIMDMWMLLMFPVIITICVTNTIVFQGLSLLKYTWYDVFLANMILFSHVIQISVYLSIEIIRIVVSWISFTEKFDVKFNTTNVLSNLGMVEYIVTDKTGTLTENKLDVALFVVNDKLYVNDDLVEESEDSERDGSIARLNPSSKAAEGYNGEIHVFKELQSDLSPAIDNEKLQKFFTCLAICNLAYPVESGFIAISVDDKVLAQTAANFGVQVLCRDSDSCLLNIHGTEVCFDILGTQAFSSDIKKSRIVVRNTLDGEVIMFVKGNRDSMVNIYDSISYTRNDVEDAIVKYRTLFLGLKRMTPHEAQEFLFDYQTAQLSPVNRQGRVENVFQKFEKDLEYLGIVGLEDVVSPETKDTVETLKQAGIKFWVLSGDSEESTLTAAVAAGIFKTENKIIRLVNFSSELDCMNTLQDSIRENIYPDAPVERNSVEDDVIHNLIPMAKSDMAIPAAISVVSVVSVEDMIPAAIPRKKGRRSTLFVRDNGRRSSVHPLVSKLSMFKKKTSLQGEYNPKNMKFVLSVDSTGLEYGTSSKEHLKNFTALLFTAKSVCFHSLLPDQKTKVVKLIKGNFRFSPLVMSVGDGISDVGMIQESDIGIGIEGKEGSEAALSADISIQRFSQLKELTLIYGHRMYVQLAKMILLSFYVMTLLEAELIIYNPLTGWTAGSLLEKEFTFVYKLIINILPVAGLCILDKDSSSTFLTPKAYKVGIFNALLTWKNLLVYVFTGLAQAGFTFVCTHLYFSNNHDSGYTESSLIISCSVYLIISTTVFISVLVETYSISVKTISLYFCFIGIQFAILIPLSYSNSELYGFVNILLKLKSIWFYMVFTTLFNFVICYFIKAVRYIFVPNMLEKVRIASPSNSVQLDSRLGQYRKTLKLVYRESVIWQHRSAYDDTAINYKTLKFISRYREKIYQADKLAENIKNYRILLLIGGVSVCIYTIYALIAIEANAGTLSFHLAFSFIMPLGYFLPSIPNFRPHALKYLIVNYSLIQAFFLVSQIAFNFSCLPMITYLPVLYLIGFSNFWLEMTLLVMASNVISAIISAFSFIANGSSAMTVSIEVVAYCIVYLCICLTASLVAYNIDKSKRLEFVLVQKVQIEISKAKSVLSFLLPPFVTKRVNDGVRYISEYQGVVSVIFCDINNFESILKYYSPQELTAFLDEVYGRFDQICMLSGCTKIETVGKTYMACAGLRDSESEMDTYYTSVPHARRCIEMGLAIIRNAEKIYLKNREVLQFNIGINSGPVTAGVVGYHKPQFSLVGDTVNTASRMASLCPRPNTLQISSETFSLIGDKTGLIFDPSEVLAKGKGLMKTFLVSVPEVQNSFSPTKNVSLSSSISEMFSLKNARPSKKTKKVTLYYLSNLHSDNDRRRSSMLDDLEAEVANDNEFFRRETEVLENVKWLSIGCTESNKERKFRIDTSAATYPIAMYGMILRVVSNVILMILVIIQMSQGRSEIYAELLKLIIEAVVVSCIIYKFKAYYMTIWYCWLISSICLIGAIFRFDDMKNNSEIVFIQYVYHMLQAAHCSQLLFKNLIWAGSLAVLAQFVYSIVVRNTNWVLQILASLLFYFILLFTIYTRENKLRYFTTLKNAAEKKLKQTESLLTQMMPRHVFESLKEHYTVTESISNVTLLYADIVGFTQWSSEKRPDEVVNMLYDLFTEFDRRCIEYEVYKVHTIGDCYVAMGYTGSKPRSETIECYRLAKFALALVDIIKEKNKENGTNLNMRIGMHTGDIIGGIAGTNIIRYDIYGVDVYISNKMESNGKPGCIKISEASMKILHNNWPRSFVFNRDEDVIIPITNSRIKTYFLEQNPMEGVSPLGQ